MTEPFSRRDWLKTVGAVSAGALVPLDSLSAGAVSYTHLRAPETVLDLVCRLLLEKKQTHNSNV